MLLWIDIIDQVFLVPYLKEVSFSFACQVELEFRLGLRIHEIARVLLSDAGSSDTDDVVIDLIWNRHEVGVCHVDSLFANDEMDSESLSVISVFDGHGAKNQENCSSDYQYGGQECNCHNSFHHYIPLKCNHGINQKTGHLIVWQPVSLITCSERTHG